MSLKSGTLLGPYEILTALGAGGMGGVYRARDTRLERTVAIKILLRELSNASAAGTASQQIATSVPGQAGSYQLARWVSTDKRPSSVLDFLTRCRLIVHLESIGLR